jgi:hypothetical protein
MYDMAKRSLAFTVATGGLLLTGTGYAPADAAVSLGSLPGPAQAQGSAAVNQASPSSVNTPISVRTPDVLQPKKPSLPRTATSGAGAAASSTVKNSGGILSGNTVQIPIDLGLNLCTNQADAIAASNTVAGSTCGGPGAAGGAKSGSSATSTVSHSGGILSGNTVQAPVNIPLNVCGNQAIAGGLKNSVGGGTCGDSAGANANGSGGSGGSSATAVTDHSGGILSGNIIQAPVNVPVNACGNQANVVGIKDKVGGTDCATGGGSGSGGAGSSATAVTLNSGGIGSGLSVQTPINVPVNACGNQATVVGASNTVGGGECATSGGSTTASSATINSGGIASGTSVQTPINVPVEACGNQAGVGSVKGSVEGSECTGSTPPSSTTTSVITNSGGILSGNQPAVPINVPVNVCGDQAGVIGVDSATGKEICGTTPSTSPSPSTSASSSPSASPSSTPSHCQECGTPTPTPSTSTSSSPSSSPSSTPSHCQECGTPTPTPSTSTSSSPSSSPSGTPSHCGVCGSPSPTTTPSGCGTCSPPPPTGSPTVVPPPHHNPPPRTGHGSLAGTGADEGLALGAAGAALLAGVGLRVASKRRTR